MDAMGRLSEHLSQRVSELWKMKRDGVKIVGYTPGGYMPEELVYASGAMPICLVRGGDPEPLTESLAYMPRFQDTFCRSQNTSVYNRIYDNTVVCDSLQDFV